MTLRCLKLTVVCVLMIPFLPSCKKTEKIVVTQQRDLVMFDSENDSLIASMPPEWRRVPGTKFRILNYKFGKDNEVAVGRANGGALANLNRWLKQFNKPALESIDDLPRVQILGQEGVMVAASGRFEGGMGKPPRDDAGLLGIILETGSGLITVKMVGDDEAVAGERERLIQFVKSLRIRGQEPTESEQKPSEAGKASSEEREGIAAVIPAEWSKVPSTRFRILNYQFDKDGEVFVGRVGGSVLANVNRWLAQFGKSPLETLDDLEKVEVSGKQAVLVTAKGKFGGGMGRPPRENAGLAGIVFQEGDRIITIKMIGDGEAVAAERERLIQFAKSLRIRETAN